ncbi:MAG TPA: histidinol dehydrogenase [Solirubrobacteraceae bacterium]|nr:histidinol dehydrogenase [Solirubrobacteraceae bacterium]
MDVDVLPAGGHSPAELARALRALIPGGADVADAVLKIIADVRSNGDTGVLALTRRFDGPVEALRVPDAELDAALAGLDPAVRAGLEMAIHNVGRVAEAGLRLPRLVDFGSHEVIVREVPLDRAAVYVPGGRAPYPSTVVMGVVTARTAGVRDVVVCSPPGENGHVNPVVLAAARLCAASEVYAMGGAQAVAALAYGTESVAPVDVICGPGNLFVQEAKRQVCDVVGIDSFAGPSDVLVVVDGGVPLEPVALDLLAQAEHGPGTLVVAVSTDESVIGALEERLAGELDESAAVCRLVTVPDLKYAEALVQAFAPEHLELLGPDAETLSESITHAGSVFVGTGTAFGDYIAGSNHTLPTGGAARFASSLGPWHFRRTYTEVTIPDADALAAAATPIARAEGFAFHARSMEARIGENPR